MISIDKNAKKLSKKEAYEAITALKVGKTLSELEIDGLMLFFAPALPAKAKTAEQWVAKACADKTELREYLRYVYVRDDGKMFGCDGHRVHECDSDLEPGYYEPKTMTRLSPQPDWKYPPIERVTVLHCAGNFMLEDMTRSVSKGLNIVSAGDDAHWNEKYVGQATNGNMAGEVKYLGGVMAKLQGESEFGQYTIMGVRV